MSVKVCTRCNVEQPVENFWKQKNSKDGLRAACRSCCYSSHRKWVEANKEEHLSNLREYNKKYYQENSGEIKQAVKVYREANLDKVKEYKRKKYTREKEKVRETGAKYYKENTKKVKARVRKYQKENKAKVKQWSGERKAQVRKATPDWLTKEQWDEMNHFYWLALDLKSTSGIEYDVDHIIPLRHELVCGLHVPWNLQVLPADINRSKSNKLEST